MLIYTIFNLQSTLYNNKKIKNIHQQNKLTKLNLQSTMKYKRCIQIQSYLKIFIYINFGFLSTIYKFSSLQIYVFKESLFQKLVRSSLKKKKVWILSKFLFGSKNCNCERKSSRSYKCSDCVSQCSWNLPNLHIQDRKTSRILH